MTCWFHTDPSGERQGRILEPQEVHSIGGAQEPAFTWGHDVMLEHYTCSQKYTVSENAPWVSPAEMHHG